MDRLLTRREVENICSLKRSAIYKGMRAGTFPIAVKVGPKAVRWRLSDIEDWLESRPLATGESA